MSARGRRHDYILSMMGGQRGKCLPKCGRAVSSRRWRSTRVQKPLGRERWWWKRARINKLRRGEVLIYYYTTRRPENPGWVRDGTGVGWTQSLARFIIINFFFVCVCVVWVCYLTSNGIIISVYDVCIQDYTNMNQIIFFKILLNVHSAIICCVMYVTKCGKYCS